MPTELFMDDPTGGPPNNFWYAEMIRFHKKPGFLENFKVPINIQELCYYEIGD